MQERSAREGCVRARACPEHASRFLGAAAHLPEAIVALVGTEPEEHTHHAAKQRVRQSWKGWDGAPRENVDERHAERPNGLGDELATDGEEDVAACHRAHILAPLPRRISLRSLEQQPAVVRHACEAAQVLSRSLAPLLRAGAINNGWSRVIILRVRV